MVEIHLSDWHGDPGMAVSTAADNLGLVVSSDGSLRSYPGSRHWHLKKPKSAGTLEITLWPQRDRLWVTYHSNRIGDGWVAETAERMADELASMLGAKRGRAVTD